MPSETSREVVAIFHDETAMERALAALQDLGIGPDAIDMLASCETVESKLGHRFKNVSELEEAPVPRVAYVPTAGEHEFQHTLIGALTYVATGFGLILASSTGLAEMLIAATAAGGAVATAGGALSWLVGHRHAHKLLEQLKCGGLLIWVRVANDSQAQAVVAALKAHGGDDVHVREQEMPAPQQAEAS